MYMPLWVAIFLICTNIFTLMLALFIVYFFAGIHDLFFVKYRNHDTKAPYFIEGRNRDDQK